VDGGKPLQALPGRAPRPLRLDDLDGRRVRVALGRQLRLRRVLHVLDARRWRVERSHRQRLTWHVLEPLTFATYLSNLSGHEVQRVACRHSPEGRSDRAVVQALDGLHDEVAGGVDLPSQRPVALDGDASAAFRFRAGRQVPTLLPRRPDASTGTRPGEGPARDLDVVDGRPARREVTRQHFGIVLIVVGTVLLAFAVNVRSSRGPIDHRRPG